MDHRDDEQARLRDEEDRELFAIRSEEREMAAEERKLERELKALGENDDRIEQSIEAEWRKEHWGHEPGRPPSWRVAKGERREPGRGDDA